MDESRKQREEFEKWWDEEGWDKKLSNVQGVMFNRIKTGMFTAWIASREAIKIELLDINQYLAELENKTLSLDFRRPLKTSVPEISQQSAPLESKSRSEYERIRRNHVSPAILFRCGRR